MVWHSEFRYLLNERGYLFATSANMTGDTAIGTAAAVDELFQTKMLVVEADSSSN